MLLTPEEMLESPVFTNFAAACGTYTPRPSGWNSYPRVDPYSAYGIGAGGVHTAPPEIEVRRQANKPAGEELTREEAVGALREVLTAVRLWNLEAEHRTWKLEQKARALQDTVRVLQRLDRDLLNAGGGN